MNRALPTILVLLFLVIPAQAGEYGLGLSFDSKRPCNDNIDSHRNTCHPENIIEDMEQFFIQGNELKIKAAYMGYLHGSVWLGNKGEKLFFYRGLVSLLISDDLKKEKELISFMKRFPFKSMRKALEEEISRGGHSETARKRLEQVYSHVMANKKGAD